MLNEIARATTIASKNLCVFFVVFPLLLLRFIYSSVGMSHMPTAHNNKKTLYRSFFFFFRGFEIGSLVWDRLKPIRFSIAFCRLKKQQTGGFHVTGFKFTIYFNWSRCLLRIIQWLQYYFFWFSHFLSFSSADLISKAQMGKQQMEYNSFLYINGFWNGRSNVNELNQIFSERYEWERPKGTK